MTIGMSYYYFVLELKKHTGVVIKSCTVYVLYVDSGEVVWQTHAVTSKTFTAKS